MQSGKEEEMCLQEEETAYLTIHHFLHRLIRILHLYRSMSFFFTKLIQDTNAGIKSYDSMIKQVLDMKENSMQSFRREETHLHAQETAFLTVHPFSLINICFFKCQVANIFCNLQSTSMSFTQLLQAQELYKVHGTTNYST